jgi:DNA-binding transcriptional MocR family regulator
VPTYLQLVQQVEQALQLGYLVRGDQLPRVRDGVGSPAINPNTVLKAYRELEHRGIAAGRPGQGTFVEAAPSAVPLAELTGLRKNLLAGCGPPTRRAWTRTACRRCARRLCGISMNAARAQGRRAASPAAGTVNGGGRHERQPGQEPRRQDSR